MQIVYVVMTKSWNDDIAREWSVWSVHSTLEEAEREEPCAFVKIEESVLDPT